MRFKPRRAPQVAPMSQRQRQGLPPELVENPNSLGEYIKTAIDEDSSAFVYFGLSVVPRRSLRRRRLTVCTVSQIGSICCWSGCLVMPEWIYWGKPLITSARRFLADAPF
jgi:hypothetical protein